MLKKKESIVNCNLWYYKEVGGDSIDMANQPCIEINVFETHQDRDVVTYRFVPCVNDFAVFTLQHIFGTVCSNDLLKTANLR